jgi:hypothetical protein
MSPCRAHITYHPSSCSDTLKSANASSLWQLILTIISIRTKNTIQVTAVSLFNYAFLAWAVIQVNELGEILGGLNAKTLQVDGKNKLITLPLNVLTGVIIGVVGAGCLALSWLAWVIRNEFGYVILSVLGVLDGVGSGALLGRGQDRSAEADGYAVSWYRRTVCLGCNIDCRLGAK